MIVVQKEPLHAQIYDYLVQKGIKMSFVADSLCISRPYFCLALQGKRTMSEKVIAQINLLLGTDFVAPEPTPEILPHEQLQIDRESLRDKPLFKEE